MTERLRCDNCGGALMWDASHDGAACLFCGTMTLRVERATEPATTPDLGLGASIGPAAAQARFRAWTRGSWFRPRDLGGVESTVQLLWLPAWRVEARLETHYTGLVRAPATRAGRKPVAGVEFGELSQMIPASAGLRADELEALGPFDETDAGPWTEVAEAGVWEPPALSRGAARVRVHEALADQHREAIAQARGLVRARVSPLIEERDLRLLMLPIYIGTFRYRDRPWRFLINAQSGTLVGEAPVDRLKVAALVLAALVLAVLVILVLRG